MARFTIDHPAPPGGWDEVRPRLETALAAHLPGRLKPHWEQEGLRISGAGARASIRLIGGRLRTEAHLRPPASFFSAVIERELRRAMEEAWPVDGGADPSEGRS